MEKVKNMKDFFQMYIQGFSNMSKMSKTLWIIIFIKLFIMFAIMRVFLFPDFLNSITDNAEEKADYVTSEITRGIDCN